MKSTTQVLVEINTASPQRTTIAAKEGSRRAFHVTPHMVTYE